MTSLEEDVYMNAIKPYKAKDLEDLAQILTQWKTAYRHYPHHIPSFYLVIVIESTRVMCVFGNSAVLPEFQLCQIVFNNIDSTTLLREQLFALNRVTQQNELYVTHAHFTVSGRIKPSGKGFEVTNYPKRLHDDKINRTLLLPSLPLQLLSRRPVCSNDMADVAFGLCFLKKGGLMQETFRKIYPNLISMQWSGARNPYDGAAAAQPRLETGRHLVVGRGRGLGVAMVYTTDGERFNVLDLESGHMSCVSKRGAELENYMKEQLGVHALDYENLCSVTSLEHIYNYCLHNARIKINDETCFKSEEELLRLAVGSAPFQPARKALEVQFFYLFKMIIDCAVSMRCTNVWLLPSRTSFSLYQVLMSQICSSMLRKMISKHPKGQWLIDAQFQLYLQIRPADLKLLGALFQAAHSVNKPS
ncbi:hypothetical protein PCE1_004307 [Barthelona sp. PCE]